MSDQPTSPPNTYRRRCRYCGAEVIEAVTTSQRVARFDSAPSAAGDVRFLADGTATYLGPADAANARAAGISLYRAHNLTCTPPAATDDTGGERAEP